MAGLTFELKNIRPFEEELKNLAQIVDRVNATLVSSQTGFNNFSEFLDTVKGKMATTGGLDKSTANFTQVFDSIVGSLKGAGLVTTGSSTILQSAKAIQILISSIGQINTAIASMPAEVDAERITRMSTMLTAISKALSGFSQISGVSIQGVGSGLQSIISALQEIMAFFTQYAVVIGNRSFLDRLFGRNPQTDPVVQAIQRLGPIVSVISTALIPLSRFNFSNLVNVGPTLNGILNFLRDFALFSSNVELTKTVQTTRFFFFKKTTIEAADFIQSLIPVMSVLTKALSALSGVTISSGSAANFTNLLHAISQIINTFATLDLTKADTQTSRGGFLGFFKREAGSIGIMVETFKVIGKALDQLGSSTKKLGTNQIKNLDDLSNVLGRIARVFEKFKGIGDVSGMAKQITLAMSEFSKIAMPTSAKTSFSTKLLGGLTEGLSDIVRVGGTLTKFGITATTAIAKGLTHPTVLGVLKKAGSFLFDDFIQAARDKLEMSSPSRVFMRMGTSIIDGLRQGLTGLASLATGMAKGFVDAFTNGLRSLQTQIGNIGQSLTTTGRSMFYGGRNLAIAGGIGALIAGNRTQMVAEFDQTLNQIRIFGNLQGEALQEVSDKVLQFSAETIFDPQQSAAAFLGLQKAGLSVIESLRVLPEVGNLAAAGNMDLTQATMAVVSAMQAFGLSVENTTDIVDSYSQAANLSTAEVAGLQEGMSNVGPIAHSFGLSFDQTVAILSMFNDAGVRGAEAGTQLKSMLTNLTRPTNDVQNAFKELGVSLTDSEGNFKGIQQIINELSHSMYDMKTITVQVGGGIAEENKQMLEDAGDAYAAADRQLRLTDAGLRTTSARRRTELEAIRVNATGVIAEITGSQEKAQYVTTQITRSQSENFRTIQELAGRYGQIGLSILLSQDADAIDKFVAEMDTVPTAAKVASEMMNTFKGRIESLKGSIQTLTIKAFMPLMNHVLKPIFDVLIRVVNAFASLPGPILAIFAGILVLGAALTTFIGIGMLLISAVLIPLGIMFTAVSMAIGAVLFVITNPLGLIAMFAGVVLAGGALIIFFTALTGAIAFVGGAFAIFINEFRKSEEAMDSLKRFTDAIKNFFSAVKEAISTLFDFIGAFSDVMGQSSSVNNAMQPVTNFFDGITEKINKATQGLQEFKQFLDLLSDTHAFTQGGIPDTTAAISDQINALDRAIDAYDQLEGATTQAQTTQPTHTVASGESIWSIAQANNMTVPELLALNPDIPTIQTQGTISTSQEAVQGLTAPRTIPIIRPGQQINLAPAQSQNQELSDLIKQRQDLIERQRFIQKDEEAFYSGISEEQRFTTGLQSRIEAFSKTGLGQKIFGMFGIKGDDIGSFLFALAPIEGTFKDIGVAIDKVKKSIVGLFTGKNGLGDIALNIQRLFGEGSVLFEQLTGADISDRLQKILLEGTTKDLLGYIGDIVLNFFISLGGLIVEGMLSLIRSMAKSLITSLTRMFREAVGEEVYGNVLAGFSRLGEKFREFRDSLAEFAQSEQGQALIWLLKQIGAGLLIVAGILGGILIVNITMMMSVIRPILDVLGNLALIIQGIAQGDWTKVTTGLSGLGEALIDLPLSILAGITDGLSIIATFLGDEELAGKFDRAGVSIKKFGEDVKATAGEGFDKIIAFVAGLNIDWEGIGTSISGFFDKIKVAVGEFDFGYNWTKLKEFVSAVGDYVSTLNLEKLGTDIATFFTAIKNSVATINFGDAWGDVKEFLSGMLTAISGFTLPVGISDLSGVLAPISSFIDTLQGIIDKVDDTFIAGFNEVKGVINSASGLLGLGGGVEERPQGPRQPTTGIDTFALATQGITTLIDQESIDAAMQPLIDKLIEIGTLADTTVSNILTYFFNMPTSLTISVDNISATLQPLITKFQAVESAVRGAADSINLFRQLMGGGATVPIPQHAYGGSIPAGQLVEFNEQRKNVPFETFQVGNRNYLLSSQPGYMHSPLGGGMTGGNITGDTYYSETVQVEINGTNLSPDQLASAVEEGINRRNQRDPARLRLLRAGK